MTYVFSEVLCKTDNVDLAQRSGATQTRQYIAGFMTVEQAEAGPNQLRFKLVRIGRISFSHDSAVRLVWLPCPLQFSSLFSEVEYVQMFREWTLLDEQHFESRLLMTTTVTRRLMEHTSVIYKKIYPAES
ncbi:hypothetical protein ANCDUO_13213 [Ancylostoma duodenale]|uniref:Uncharacterized protein n=1 Tax=Ancylostoma duodenale TaxID=51022 RepID=A0A0C2CJI1_9BILA|nr:hypothetical protein ANCDUO_13213 [Ancylostoma duodenale]